MVSCMKLIQYSDDFDIQEFIHLIPDHKDYFSDKYKLMDEIKE